MKIIIADDEKLIRQSIRFHLLSLGFKEEEIDEAANGQILVQQLKKGNYDIALVDVKMPILNGIEAIRQGKPFAKNTLFYILSGFDEFKFAQEAIRIGIKDYLLKPIRKNDLEQIVETAIITIEQKRSEFCSKLKVLISEILEEPGKEVVFPINGQALFVTNDNINEESILTHQLFELTKNMFFIQQKVSKKDITILFLFPNSGWQKENQQVVKSLVKHLLRFSTVYESCLFSDSQTFYKEYNRILCLSSQRILTGIRKFYKKGILSLNLSPDMQKIAETGVKMMNSYRNKNYSEFVTYSKALVSMEQQLNENNFYKEHFYDSIKLFFGIREDSFCLKTQLEEMGKKLLIPKRSRETIAEKAVAYIKSHYQEDLSINSMANLYSITPNYFSSIFHKATGKTFIQYLTEVRIQEGKRLILETNLTIDEITEKIGYYSTSYFIKRFVQIEGITPAEYRNQNI